MRATIRSIRVIRRQRKGERMPHIKLRDFAALRETCCALLHQTFQKVQLLFRIVLVFLQRIYSR